MMQTITLTFHEGSSTVETTGFKGASCKDATRAIEAALGQVTQVQKKPEFHAVGAVKQAAQTHLGNAS